MTAQESADRRPKLPPWLQGALLAALVVAVLLPALGADFVWDDLSQIVESSTIGDWHQVPSYFHLNVVQSKGDVGVNAPGLDLYRPLFMTALTAIFSVHGADPLLFHLATVLAHVGVCLLLWLLVRRWVGSDGAAAGAVVLFAFHPVAAEAYLWPSAISEPMSAAGLIGAVLLVELAPRRDRTSWALATTAGVVLLSGLLSKEAILLALPPLAIFLVRARGVRAAHLAPSAAAAVVFLLLRSAALGGLEAAGAGWEQRLDALRNLPVVLLDGLRAMVTMSPVGVRHLSYEYEDLRWVTAVAAAVVVALVAVAAWRVRRRRPLVTLAAAIAGCMLAPVALVATVPGWGGFGRYLYVPWAFAALAAADVGRDVVAIVRRDRPRLLPVLGVLAVVYLAAQQVGLRTAMWTYSSQENLARSSIELRPRVPDGYLWLGNVYMERGELATALEYYREAVRLAPELYDARQNLAAALLVLGRPAEALAQVDVVEEQHGVTTESSVVRIRADMALGRWHEAGRRMLWILERDPSSRALADLQQELLRRHPQPQTYRRWLVEQLQRPDLAVAAGVVLPMISGRGR